MKHVAMVLLAAAVLVGAVGCESAVMRVNCGGKEFAESEDVTWSADQVLQGDATWGAVGGMTVERVGLKIPGCTREKLYVTERYSMTAYQFALDNGTYTVRLHFAETFSQLSKAGERLFSVKINGDMKLKDLDVLKEAGGFGKPLVKECAGIEVTDGKLRIEFVANVQNPEINAIEILTQ